MASRGDKGNGNGEEQIVEVNRCGLHFWQLTKSTRVLNEMMVADFSGGVPLLHLYGEAGGRTPLSSLLEAVLLRLRAAMADGAAVAMSPLSSSAAPSWTSQLPLGRGGHAADRDDAAEQLR